MEQITIADKRLLRNVLKSLREVPPNLCPTFYNTLSYEGDLKIKAHADEIARKLNIDED